MKDVGEMMPLNERACKQSRSTHLKEHLAGFQNWLTCVILLPRICYSSYPFDVPTTPTKHSASQEMLTRLISFGGTQFMSDLSHFL